MAGIFAAARLVSARCAGSTLSSKTHYWQRLSLREEAITRSLLRRATVSCCSGTGDELSPVQSLFEKPKPESQQVVQPGFASFSPDGQWLFIIPPTLASAASAETAGQGPPQQGAGGGSPGSRPRICKLQIWRWSPQKRTYESAGEDLEFQRLPGSRMINFAWSPESDRVVLINTRLNETECTFFEVKGNTFEPLLDESNKLNSMKIVALAFARNGSQPIIPGIAASIAASVDSATPAMRKVSFIGADDLQLIPEAMNGKDSNSIIRGFPTKWHRLRARRRPTYPDELERHSDPRSP